MNKMGLKSPFGYVNMELKMLGTAIVLQYNFCRFCHSNREWKNSCDKCPTGNLINACMDYFKDVEILTPSNKNRASKEYYIALDFVKKLRTKFPKAYWEEGVEREEIQKFEYLYLKLEFNFFRRYNFKKLEMPKK